MIGVDLFGNPDPSELAAARVGGSLSGAGHGNLPLAVRLRPQTLDEIVTWVRGNITPHA